jgi:hypothetical protein
MRNDLARVGCPAGAVLPRGGSQFVKEDRHQRLSTMRVSHRGARRYVFSGREMRKHKSRIHAAKMRPNVRTICSEPLSWSLLIPHDQLKQIGVGANSV